MANVIHIGVENPDELLNAGLYGAASLIRLQWSATETGTFADVSGTGSTPTTLLIAATTAYTGYDPVGASTTWYRTRYENAAATRLSDWSAPFLVGSSVYCSLDDVKQRLQRTTDTVDDELFSEYIAEATDYIRGYIGRDLLDTAISHTYDGNDAYRGGRCLLIPRGVRSISLLETAATTGGSFTTVTAGDYFLRPTTQERTPGWPATELWLSDLSTSLYTFPRGYDNVRITGTFGYASIPLRVEEVALNLVVRMYASRQAGQSELIGSGGEGGSPLVSAFLSKRDRDTLQVFRSLNVG